MAATSISEMAPFRRIRMTGLAGASQAYTAAEHLRVASFPVLFIVPREDEAETFLNDLELFSQALGTPKKLYFCNYPSRLSDTDPSQITEPHIFSKRIAALHHLLEHPERTVVVASLKAIAQKTIPKEVLLNHTNLVQVGAELDRDAYVQELLASGYEKESRVEEHGSFAVRGGVVDVFPPHADVPSRIEWIGDTIESIRTFEIESQRSLENVRDLSSLPCREILFTSEDASRIRSALKTLADEKDLPPQKRAPLEEAIQDGRYLPAFEPLLPLFYETPSTLSSYSGKTSTWISIDPFTTRQELEQLRLEIERTTQDIQTRPILASPADTLSINISSFGDWLSETVGVEIGDVAIESTFKTQAFHTETLENLRRSIMERLKKENPLAPLIESVDHWRGTGNAVLFVSSTPEDAKKLYDLLSPTFKTLSIAQTLGPDQLEEAKDHPLIIVGHLSQGFVHSDAKVVFISEHELFRSRKHAIAKEIQRDDFLTSINELSPGDFVVHLDFGVGQYKGLERITVGGLSNDFLHLEYAGGDKLYIPVYRLNRIQKYVGGEHGSTKVDRLGNQSAWESKRKKAERAVAEMAQELVELYAKRRVAKGHAFGQPDHGYIQFENDFPFEETRDQLRTLNDVFQDLESEKPMDRLVCGDVGFGKTEIALRAAFRVASEGKQVAVLVPTTVLAQQHFETFEGRFKEYGIRVEFLSRFKQAADQKKVIQQLKEGKIDIVVGTHRLLSKDVAFRDLGLLIIDEEHRFGVTHKERIKQFRNNVHVMTLTATPIPRTLQMSMAGIRDLSVINTPPLDRKAIQTYLCRFEDSVLQGAIRKELSRGGQVFFVHNKVETIHAMGSYLKKLIPEARIEIGHGQMEESQLEKVMHNFLEHKSDVLLCTTIVESGLDIPRANTILVNRADQFGLAQLYQLRGRVGRSEREAYAYLLIPGEELISRDALKRLKVLKRFTELGSGLKIALHDLEIRGAGNLLGASQSGHIAAIGLELYTQLLDREVRKLKGEDVKDEIDPEIQCPYPAFIPEEYVASTGERLLLYKRLSSAKSENELLLLKDEIRDRFGPFPPTVENLLEIIELKILARTLGVSALKLGGERPTVEFSDQANVDLNQLLALVKKDKRLTLRPDSKLVLALPTESHQIQEMKDLLKKLVRS